MREKKEENELYIPAIFVPFQTVMPGVQVQLRVSDVLNLAAIVCADYTHRKVFLPFLDAIDEIEDERDACQLVLKTKMKDRLPGGGMICRIRHVDVSDKNILCNVVLEGECKAICTKLSFDKTFGENFFATLLPVEDTKDAADSARPEAIRRLIVSVVKRYMKIAERMESFHVDMSDILGTKDNDLFCYRVLQTIGADYKEEKRVILATDTLERLKVTLEIAQRLTEFAEIQEDVIQETTKSITDQQREAFLREQIRMLEEEIGDDDASECELLEETLDGIRPYLADSTAERIAKEISRMKKIPSASPDFAVMKMHVDFLLGLPWAPEEKPDVDLAAVRRILDRDHYGLTKVKDRIVEFMAVKTMKKATASSIICLFGPPGTGKTSIVRSIAEALKREYVRISLGGVRDEAEIRGHRKTYIGAMPGRILTAIEKAKSNSPVILLDEIDKICGDFRGDPASALLEVLDREQNREFTDSYAEVPFDLSNVLFITTANSLDTIPTPLLDRLEVIELSSYTENEKTEIAKRHLIPKQAKEHGLAKNTVKFTDDAIDALINEYTQEAGVRSLERQIAAVMRKSICLIRTENKKRVTVNRKMLFDMLGAGRAIHRFETEPGKTSVGSVNGMAWTSIGGVLLNVEVNVLDGTGKLDVTGLIGDVMRESAVAALSFIRSRASVYGIAPDFYKTKDIHVHVPEGATPKDGPSAGVTIVTAILSALTGIPVKQSVAMTGEITIRGDVLAIGGLKEKSLAALKEGISEILVPAENSADVMELPDEVKAGLKVTMVKSVDEVLEAVLVRDEAAKPADINAENPTESQSENPASEPAGGSNE
ncbi:MAG: endopeptidase La [Clostridia bacterium]|nr:endopeptidase La [Clostridia bacterium]